MGNEILSSLEYWLVSHPKIRTFSWIPGRTFASSPPSVAAAVIAYVSLTWLLPRLPLPYPKPYTLKLVTAIHSLVLVILSLAMAIGCALAILRSPLRWAVCFPADTRASGPLFFWAYVFYLSKFLELGDTLLIIMSGSLKRLTFLHVYHHATVLVMCFLWLEKRQSLFPVALVTNAGVHVVMYYYYLCCAVGKRPRWKKAVTNVQIVQFVFSFAVSGWMLHSHLFQGGCCGLEAWCFNAVFNGSLLFLFLDFHVKSYRKIKEATHTHKQS